MTKINISFFTRKIPKGASVYARITFAGNEVKTSTGIVLQSLEQFSKTKMKIVKHPEADRLNLKLAKIETRIYEVFNFYANKEILLTKELLLEGLKNNVRNKTTLYDYGRSWLKANQKRIAYGTYRQLLDDLNKFDRFVPGIHISDIEKSILIRYHRYLLIDLNNNPNTAQRSLKKVKFFCNQALNEGLIKENPFAGLSFKGAPTQEISCLTELQIDALENYPWPSPRLLNTAKLFLFQCYTGLAYIDLYSLKPVHIDNINGKKWIRKSRHKSDISALIPLFPKALEILQDLKFFENGKLPVPTNQKYNESLKDVAQLAGIKNKLSSHVGRKTCGMILLNNGVSIEAVSRILGHSSIKTTQNFYAKAKEQLIEKETENFKVFG